MKDVAVTVYTGPAQELLVNNQLRGQGATYFEPNTITNIHSTKKALIQYVTLALVAHGWN